jgi:excisionase family DNA binding protein
MLKVGGGPATVLQRIDGTGGGIYPEGMDRITVDLDKQWLSVADICGYMDVSEFVVTSLLRSGALPAVKFGREWRVARLDFEDWINAQRFEAATRNHLGRSS